MLSAKHGGKGMAIIHDFVEDWIEMRSKLQRQLKLLESGKTGTGTNVIGSTTEATIIRLKKWIDELNDLLKEYAHADRT
jgi:hypothetical protein